VPTAAPPPDAPARRPWVLRPAGARCRHRAGLPRSHPLAGQRPTRPASQAPALGRRGGAQLVQPLPQAPRSLREAPRKLPGSRPSRRRHYLLEESSAYLWIGPYTPRPSRRRRAARGSRTVRDEFRGSTASSLSQILQDRDPPQDVPRRGALRATRSAARRRGVLFRCVSRRPRLPLSLPVVSSKELRW